MIDLDTSYSYPKPPLAEVIAEVRWRLTPLTAVPGGAVDPFYVPFRDYFARKVEKLGYSFKEPLVEADFPLELFAGNPAIRLRPGGQKWPLFQLGPGLLTMNITPPYGGWQQFSAVIAEGLSALSEFFNSESRLFQPSQLKLHYLDAFTAEHGMDNYNRFIQQELHFLKPPTSGIWAALKKGETDGAILGEVRFKLEHPEASVLTIRIRPGQRSGVEAAIADFVLVKESNIGWPADLMPWFQEAHKACRLAFESSISDKLRASFGKKEPVQ